MRELWKHFKIDDYDIRIDECGIQQFNPDENYSYLVYQNYILHYVESGYGTFIVNNDVYELGPSDGFILRQGQQVTYYGDKDNPWQNKWVGIGGTKFKKLIHSTSLYNQPTVHFEKNSEIPVIISDICDYTLNTPLDNLNVYWYQSKIYELLHALSTEFPSQKSTLLIEQSYAEIAYEYINTNYSKNFSINQLASYIGISRSYLYKLFKEKYGKSPQEYLIMRRMNKAVDLLLHTDKPINVIASEISYHDQLHFSKAFKSTYGVSPTEFKRINNVEQFI